MSRLVPHFPTYFFADNHVPTELDAYRQYYGVTVREMANAMNIPYSRFGKMCDGSIERVYVDEIMRLCLFFEVPIEQFVTSGGKMRKPLPNSLRENMKYEWQLLGERE